MPCLQTLHSLFMYNNTEAAVLLFTLQIINEILQIVLVLPKLDQLLLLKSRLVQTQTRSRPCHRRSPSRQLETGRRRSSWRIASGCTLEHWQDLWSLATYWGSTLWFSRSWLLRCLHTSTGLRRRLIKLLFGRRGDFILLLTMCGKFDSFEKFFDIVGLIQSD